MTRAIWVKLARGECYDRIFLREFASLSHIPSAHSLDVREDAVCLTRIMHFGRRGLTSRLTVQKPSRLYPCVRGTGWGIDLTAFA